MRRECGECIKGCLNSFVVGEVTSIVTRIVLGGSGVGIWKIVLRKCVVSLM